MAHPKSDAKDRLIRDMLKVIDFCAESRVARVAARIRGPAFVRRAKKLKVKLTGLEWLKS